jgi:hypothetical protein
MLGRVFLVDDHIKDNDDINAKMYSHHHCFPNSSPGNMIDSFVANAQNSTVLGLFQYFLLPIVLRASIHSIFIISYLPLNSIRKVWGCQENKL